MTQLLTPGFYRQPVEPVRRLGRLARGDIPVFLGYAARGPAGLPVRVESLGQVETLFGPPVAGAHLWHAVKGFFETGGRTAYILRLALPRARTARAILGEGALRWRATASFPWALIDPRKLKTPPAAEAANWVKVVERVLRENGPRSADPGAWANGLTLRLRETAGARAGIEPPQALDDRLLPVDALAGFEDRSVLRLGQIVDGTTRSATVVPARIDAARQAIALDRPLDALGAGFVLGLPMSVETVEFDVEIHDAGRLVQSFRGLGPHPGHSRAILSVMQRDCRDLGLLPVAYRNLGTALAPRWEEDRTADPAALLAGTDWADPVNWPATGDHALGGGADGLEAVTGGDYLAALPEIARLPEVALIAAPDLTIQDPGLPETQSPLPDRLDCLDLSPAQESRVAGRVISFDNDGLPQPVVGAVLDALGPGGQTRSAADGGFELTGIPAELVTLRVTHGAHEPLEYLVQATPFATAEPVEIVLDRLIRPQPLDPAEILRVQAAMGDPATVGPYKVAILDPLAPDASPDDLRTWRARLGNSDRTGFFAPWLRLPGEALCPPSGHVCGAFAAGELAQGLHRTGANLPLKYVEGTSRAFGEDEQSLLHPDGINAIRAFPGRGIRLFGSRSLSPRPELRQLTARRIVDAIEKSLERGLAWIVFEPNTLITRHAAETTLNSFLNRLWRDGILAGDSPEAAYSVKSDLENNPQDTRDAGQLVIEIGLAPTEPYEFVLFRLGHAFDALKVTEETT